MSNSNPTAEAVAESKAKPKTGARWNGHLDELLYERGTIATNVPFADLKQRAHINATARAADKDADFSKHIRENMASPL